MKYVSTRGGGEAVGFDEALLAGYAVDGGLFVPASLPSLDWHSFRHLSLPDIIKRILPHFMDGVDEQVLGMVDEAYSRFDIEGGIRVEWVKKREVGVAELFHGPTWAFKDYSLIFLGHLLQHILEKRKESRNILVATSGDTGSSAMEALANRSNLTISVLYPHNRISRVQRHQMVTVQGANVHPYAVDGDSDELDAALLPLYSDPELAHLNLGCINSINWGRILVQMAHWFWAYFQAAPEDDMRVVRMVAPTGACGNITAGLYARALGLPVHIVATTGHNDVLHRLFATASFHKDTTRPSLATAMDIQTPYNVERIFHLLSGGDTKLTTDLMTRFNAGQNVAVPPHIMTKLGEVFESQAVSDADILATIQRVKREMDYFVCPHTATSLFYALGHPDAAVRTVCMATASPDKFGETMEAAGVGWGGSAGLRALLARPERPHPFFPRDQTHPIPAWTAALKRALLSYPSQS